MSTSLPARGPAPPSSPGSLFRGASVAHSPLPPEIPTPPQLASRLCGCAGVGGVVVALPNISSGA
eukprot:781824-Pelagomonas_calceolata.AAC.1